MRQVWPGTFFQARRVGAGEIVRRPPGGSAATGHGHARPATHRSPGSARRVERWQLHSAAAGSEQGPGQAASGLLWDGFPALAGGLPSCALFLNQSGAENKVGSEKKVKAGAKKKKESFTSFDGCRTVMVSGKQVH